MSLTRVRRATVLTLAGLACSAALASPAHAASSVSIQKNGGVLNIIGTAVGENITVEQLGGVGAPVVITVTGSPLSTTAPTCAVVTATEAFCDGTFQIGVSGGGGADGIRVIGATRSLLSGNGGDDFVVGGTGNDDLRGGDGEDILRGSTGTDAANGGAGSDFCSAEVEALCES
jgi:Ca2+-binding RTX toxin-like protein